MWAIVYNVHGIPRPQGSKRHVGGGRLIEASKYHKEWRDAIITATEDQADLTDQMTGPLRCCLVFHIPRPAKPKFPWPISRRAGDIDKLARTVLDALTIGGIIEDDSQIVHLNASKKYDPTWTGVVIALDKEPTS